jgi:hypothetical protein
VITVDVTLRLVSIRGRSAMNRSRLERLRSAALLGGAAALCLACLGTAAAWAADAWAPAGTKAMLSVDYVYESAGKTQDSHALQQWRVKRSVSLSAQLAAQAPSALPQTQALDAGQMAELERKGNKAQAIATQMAPMASDAHSIMQKCGDDEACLSREVQKMGAAMAGTPKMAAALQAKKDAEQAFQPGAPRYQAWRATAQAGRYVIDETLHRVHADPICHKLPQQRCTRDEQRQGAGDLALPATAQNPGAAAGFSAVELDAAKNVLTLQLPVPLQPLAYTETIRSDEPAGTHDTRTPQGPQAKQMPFRAVVDGKLNQDEPLTVALKGGWRSQSGEQVVPLKGASGETGRLIVRWRFAVQ